MQTRNTWSTITVREQLRSKGQQHVHSSKLIHGILTSRKTSEREKAQKKKKQSRRLTSFVPKLSLGLIQYRSIRPIVAYLFYSEHVSGNYFVPSSVRGLTRT